MALEVCNGAGEFMEGHSRKIWEDRKIWASKEGKESYRVNVQEQSNVRSFQPGTRTST